MCKQWRPLDYTVRDSWLTWITTKLKNVITGIKSAVSAIRLDTCQVRVNQPSLHVVLTRIEQLLTMLSGSMRLHRQVTLTVLLFKFQENYPNHLQWNCWSRVKYSSLRLILQKLSLQLKTYTEERLQVLGEMTVDVSYNSQHGLYTLYVVKGSGSSLLGRDLLKGYCYVC